MFRCMSSGVPQLWAVNTYYSLLIVVVQYTFQHMPCLAIIIYTTLSTTQISTHTISCCYCCLYPRKVSYSLCQRLANSCTGKLHQPNKDVFVDIALDLVTVSQEQEFHKPNSRTERALPNSKTTFASMLYSIPEQHLRACFTQFQNNICERALPNSKTTFASVLYPIPKQHLRACFTQFQNNICERASPNSKTTFASVLYPIPKQHLRG